VKPAAIATPILLALLSCGGPLADAFPPPYVPAQPTAVDWPDAGAAVIEDVATLTYEMFEQKNGPPRPVAILDHRRRLKILSSAGLGQATVTLAVDAFSTVTGVSARAVAPNGDTTYMVANSLVPEPIPGVRNPPREVKNLVFLVPGVQVGGLIDYRYQRVYLDPDQVPVWVFGGPLPVLRAELGIVTVPEIKVDYRYGVGEVVRDNLPLRRKQEEGRERWVFVEKDLPAYYPEPEMPHIGHVAPWLAVVMTSAKFDKQRSRFETWDDVAEKLKARLDKVGGVSGSGTTRARYAKTRALLAPLQLPGLGVREPVPFKGLERGEPACTRDAAAVLLKALDGSGSKAYAAFLAGPTGPVAVKDFPGLYPFIRAVVAVDVSDDIAKDPTCKDDPIRRGLLCTVPPDSYAFLDPLCSDCRFGELDTVFTGGQALVLHEDGPRWVDVPLDPPERNRSMAQYRFALDVDGTLTGGMTGELTGAPARRARNAVRGRDAGDTRDKLLTEMLFGEEPATRLTQVKLTGETQIEEPLRFRAKASGRLEKVDYEHYRLRAVDVAGPSLPGRWRSSRRQAMLLEAPAWSEAVASVEIPIGYEVTVPPTVKIIEPFAEYAGGFARRDRTLTYTRRLVLKTHIVAVSEWPDFRRFLDKIEETESQLLEVKLGTESP
jgi:hypothetical protein